MGRLLQRRTVLRILAGILGFLVVYALCGAFLLPWILKSQAERRLSALTGMEVRIREVGFHPFAWRLRITGLSVVTPAGGPLLSWSNVVADAQVASIWRREITLRELTVENPTLHLERLKAGGIPWQDVMHRVSAELGLDRAPTHSDTASALAWRIGAFELRNGTVRVRDEQPAAPFTAALSPVNLRILGLASRAQDGAPFHCSATGDSGESMDWSGSLSVNPPAVKLRWKADRVPVAKPRPYTDEHASVRPVAGTAAWDLSLDAAWSEAGLVARLADGRVSVEKLALRQKDGDEPFLDVDRFAVAGAHMEWPARKVEFGEIQVDGPRLHARRATSDGDARATMNWRQMIDPEVVQEWVRATADWNVSLGRLSVGNGEVRFTDSSVSPQVEVSMDGVRLEVRGFSNGSNAPPATVETGLRWLGEGDVKVSGHVALHPASADAQVELRNLSVAALAPYLARAVRLQLQRGVVAGDLGLRYGRARPGDAAPLAEVTGRLSARDVAALESGSGADFIRWKEVELQGIQVGLVPNRIALETLAVRGLQTSLVLMTNGQLNVLQLIEQSRELGNSRSNAAPAVVGAGTSGAPGVTQAAAGSAPARDAAPSKAEATSAEDAWPLHIGRVSFQEVALFATDQFYGGGFRTSVESLDGEVRSVSWPIEGPSEVDLKGRLSAVSGFDLKGWIRPTPGTFGADLRLTTQRADLRQFAPYSIRFVGYPVKEGELTAQVRYVVEGDRLKAENQLVIDRFTLGPRTPSPDALQLPLKLGVALLKDRDGRIRMDLPLTGTVSDPEFRLGPILWQAFRNLIVKAATAPFRMLGALFGGGEEELEFVEFAPGSAELSEAMAKRVQTLARALQERPTLELQVLPGFDPSADRLALARQRLEAQLQALRAEASRLGGLAPTNAIVATADTPVPATAEPSGESALPALSAEERASLLRVAYVREFGPRPATPAPASVDPVVRDGVLPPVEPGATAASPTEAVDAVAAGMTPEQIESRLMELVVVKPEELQALAERRAETVRGLLTGAGGIAPERLVKADAAAPADRAQEKARVLFRLE